MSGLALWITSRYLANDFLPWNEKRENLVVLSDPILGHPDMPQPRDMSRIVSVMSFLNILVVIVFSSWHELMIHNFALAYMFIMRILCISLCPLKMFPTAIPLRDWVMDQIGGKEGGSFCHDLFFSGHVGHACIGFFVVSQCSWFFGFSIIAAACGVLISRTHYTIDVLVAPFITWGCVSMARAAFGCSN